MLVPLGCNNATVARERNLKRRRVMGRTPLSVLFTRRLRLLIIALAVALAGMLCAAVVAPTTAVGQAPERLYEHTYYGGKSITFDTNIRDLRVYNWNDIASSVKVYCV
jgi:hypothetical protein